MSSQENGSILLEINASTFAFRAGQKVEMLLMDRALERARATKAPVVTLELIESCIDNSLLEAIGKQLDGRADDESRRVA